MIMASQDNIDAMTVQERHQFFIPASFITPMMTTTRWGDEDRPPATGGLFAENFICTTELSIQTSSSISVSKPTNRTGPQRKKCTGVSTAICSQRGPLDHDCLEQEPRVATRGLTKISRPFWELLPSLTKSPVCRMNSGLFCFISWRIPGQYAEGQPSGPPRGCRQ